MIQDMGKNARQNLSLSSSQSPFVLSTANMYHCFAFPVREKGYNFHLSVCCFMPEMLRNEHISSNSSRWLQGFSFSSPEKGYAWTMATKPGWSSPPDERFGFVGCSENSPFEVERFLRGVEFMLKKDKKKTILFLWNKRYTYKDELGSKKITTVPRQRR